MIKKILLLLVVGLILYSCTTVPVTGRRQLSLVPNSEILPLSYDQYQQVLKENKLSDNKEWSAMVKNVGRKIQGSVEQYMKQKGLSDQLKGYAWEFNLIESETVNAWCMPGGKVAFYTGIMPICKDEKGVAVVMGHEIAHAIANHGRERMSEGLVAQLGLSSLSAALGQNPTMTKQLLLQSVGVGTQLGMLAFSRTHESEADQIGLIFMAMAGYDPHEAPKFWERMEAQSSGQRPPEFLSTHPHPETRIADLKKQIPEAMKYYKR
ncbi:Zn-dependent protease [Fulvivirga imtechensis AK7]|uniref:Zn-dependent protease n=1 Tax=Fulvivirga imtechensis AK7 TaxID=1237149 RepID=L8JH03_9BACT|nr:M48 family metallopeptidase [Fulvivirga imtechensis]ELR68110.1 Zn-dependent protease [Fulvivirga imtechensis AK7]